MRDDPYPAQSQPLRPILTLKSIRDTPKLHRHEGLDVPTSMADLYRADGRYSINVKIPIPAVKLPPVDQDEAL